MNENAKIYICTHVDFDCPVHNPVYEIVDSRKLFEKDIAPDGMDNLFYSELATYFRLAQDPDKLPEIVGFCGYRKYFGFMDDVPDLSKLVDNYHCIATGPYIVRGNVYRHYAHCFSFADMDVAKAIVYSKHLYMWPSFKEMLEGNKIYSCSMFIMLREDFVEMMRFVHDVLSMWLEVVGTDIRKRIESHPELYAKRDPAHSALEHQYRIGGNLGERLISAWILHNYAGVKTYPIHFTENARPRRKLLV